MGLQMITVITCSHEAAASGTTECLLLGFEVKSLISHLVSCRKNQNRQMRQLQANDKWLQRPDINVQSHCRQHVCSVGFSQ